jgi:3-phosphoshikimate 1-carboxyvinyltransferase
LGSQIECEGLNNNSLQGDRSILDILVKMGCRIDTSNGTIKACSTGTSGTVIDGSQIPDILPVLAALASLSSGTTRIINAGRLRIKECDRLKAMHDELAKLGADIKEMDDGLLINGREYLDGGTVDSWNDHRVAMALAIASTKCKNTVTIKDSGAVKKSYPGFWNDFKKLGGIIN